MSAVAVLHKTGEGSWSAAGGAYQVERTSRRAASATETVYRVTTKRFSSTTRTANCATLAEAREAIAAWESSRGASWYLPALPGAVR